MGVAQLVEAFDALFYGRRDVYAVGYPDPVKENKLRYSTVREALTRAVLHEHMKGKHCVGVYPIVDDHVQWFAVDFDAPKDAAGKEVENPFEIAWESAKKQAEAFERAGLHVYLERSRSGKGVHVWGFFDGLVHASVVRRALKPLLTDHEIFTSRDRMFPVQPSTSGTGAGLGNLIALPFNGSVVKQGFSVFLDPETLDVIDPRTFLATVERNAVAVVEQLAEDAPAERTRVSGTRRDRREAQEPGDLDSYRPDTPLSGALQVISAYGCNFMRHCWIERRTLEEPSWYRMLGLASCFRHGRELAHALSKDYHGYDAAAVDAKYDQALGQPPIGCAWVHENRPDLACAGCPMKSPYYLARKPILELVGQSDHPMEQAGSFDEDLSRVRRFNEGKQSAGYLWHIPGLDAHTRLRPSELIVVGAMSAIGKTHLMVDAAYRIARAGMPVFVFSAETGRVSLRQRFLGRAAAVDTMALRGERPHKLTDAEWTRLETAAKELAELPLYLDYTSLSADDVLRQIEDTLLRNKIPLDSPYVVFFDYLQFGSRVGTDQSEYDKVSRLSTEFKFIAKILERPVVVFSQVRRDKEGDVEPDITWFKNSGRIEQDLDVGLIITGDRVEGSVAPRSITVVKQREGPSQVRATFQLQQTYGEYAEDNAAGPSAPVMSAWEGLPE